MAPHYHVGSFDDDAGYILTAKGLLAGSGLTGRLASGEVLVGLYPPGYSALLAPLLWVWPHSFVPLRLLSVACFAAVFPLTWVWLGRHAVTTRLRMLALGLMALGPPFATYGSMVMAETPFLVVLLLLLLAADRWREQTRVLTRAGLAVVLFAAALVWLKQAGIGMIAGLLLWLPLSRAPKRWAKAGTVLAGVALSLVPVVVARVASGIPLAGARYSLELGGFYQGGLLRRLAHVVPGSTWHLFSTALPATLVPYLDPLPGNLSVFWQVLGWHVTALVVLGAVVWFRRHRDAAVPMVIVYAAESVLWPFVNERRAILVLPLLASWYVVGAAWVWDALRHRLRRTVGLAARRATGVALVSLAVVGPLLAQMPRDYLYSLGQDSSHFGGSRYAALLRHLGRPSDVVETDYRSSVALFTGHATNWSAFTFNQGDFCYSPAVLRELGGDNAAFLLIGDVNKPGQIDNTCLQNEALLSSWAVQLLHTSRDDATVYELVGPGTGNPGLVDVLAGAGPATYSSRAGHTTLTWSLPRPAQVSQLSLGQAADEAGTTRSVRLEFQRPGGEWVVAAQTRSGVGDGPGWAPYLLAMPPRPVSAVAVRVVVDAAPAGVGAAVTDVAVLGPAPAGP